MGRFISRDPLGYVDGMSMYGGYFAEQFGLDPSGLLKHDLNKKYFTRTYVTNCHKITVTIKKGPIMDFEATELPGAKNKKECQCTKCGWVQFVKEGSSLWHYDNGEGMRHDNQVPQKNITGKRGRKIIMPANTGKKNIWYPTSNKNHPKDPSKKTPQNPSKPNPSMYDTPGVPQNGKSFDAKLVCQDSKGNNKEMLYISMFFAPSGKMTFYSNGKAKK